MPPGQLIYNVLESTNITVQFPPKCIVIYNELYQQHRLLELVWKIQEKNLGMSFIYWQYYNLVILVLIK